MGDPSSPWAVIAAYMVFGVLTLFLPAIFRLFHLLLDEWKIMLIPDWAGKLQKSADQHLHCFQTKSQFSAGQGLKPLLILSNFNMYNH